VRSAGLIAVDSIEQARIEAGDLLLAVPQSEWASCGWSNSAAGAEARFQRRVG